jgi:FlaG/FlaF family flagellin (archaellin)
MHENPKGGLKEKMKSFRRSIKAVSPVIATIIIVAIAITMSIAVAYWVLGLGSSFTKYEKVEFTSAYADYNAGTGNFTISMILKNTGSAAATVDPATIFYNGKPGSAYTGYAPFASFTSFTMVPGNVTSGLTITLLGNSTSPWQSGMTVEVMIQTTAGKQYPKVITLP